MTFAITERVENAKEWFELECTIAGVTPDRLFDCWTNRELLALWWPPLAHIDPRPGGKYHLHWPNANWKLCGTIKEFERGKCFSFAWKWNLESADKPPLEVVVGFKHGPAGAHMTIRQGPYGISEDQRKAREGHYEGWNQFLPKLQAAALSHWVRV